jgi:hypothetical protein
MKGFTECGSGSDNLPTHRASRLFRKPLDGVIFYPRQRKTEGEKLVGAARVPLRIEAKKLAENQGIVR